MSVPIVIDNGSLLFKAGYAGETSPFIMENVVGKPRFDPSSGNILFGKDALVKRGLLNLTYPVTYGDIASWDDMSMIWDHYFKRFSILTEDHPVLMTVDTLAPMDELNTIAQIMFEKFKVPSLCLVPSAELSLYASGMKSGLVFESGHEATKAVPIKDGKIVKSSTLKSLINGSEITQFMLGLVLNSLERDVAREIKEKSGYVAIDYYNELNTFKGKDIDVYGTTITAGIEIFKGPELLFQPSLDSTSSPAIPKVIYDSVISLDEGDHQAMFGNVLLSGGNTMFPGLKERLQKELQLLVGSGADVNVMVPPERNILAWLGGSKMACEPSFPQMCVTKQGYEEAGITALSKFM